MATAHGDIWASLAAPFAKGEVKQRSQAGRQFSYVTARTVMNRLDVVLGPENWWDDYAPLDHSVICRLTIRLADGTTLTKVDAGGNAGMSDQGDDDKSGFSDAFKRAAVKFGVGRYLYGDGVPHYTDSDAPQPQPEPEPQPQRTRKFAAPSDSFGREKAGKVPHSELFERHPTTGKALYAWARSVDDNLGTHIIKSINDWGAENRLSKRMVDWPDDAARDAHAHAMDRLDELGFLQPVASGEREPGQDG